MDIYDLGTHGRAITTAAPGAQTWFDRGLNWTYGFNHQEAAACFRRAAAHDPGCAMAHWGQALVAGPNYNMPWHLFDAPGRAETLRTARAALARARDCAGAGGASPAEAALIEALAARYPQDTPGSEEEMAQWDRAYAQAMRAVQAQFAEDLDIAALTAEALMQPTPWALWDLGTGTPAEGAATREVRALLEAAMARPGGMAHPGVLHMYIHLMEMSPEPEAALRAADALRELVPDAGHLVHMPTHIDVLCGDWEKAVRWNRRAIAADLKYYAREGAMNIYTGYRQHNYHFVIYAAMFLGQIAPAREALRGLEETTPEAMLRIPSPPMADYFESFMAMEPHVLIRFGRWQEILDLTLPEDRALYCTKTANILYARGVALAALGRVAEAEEAERAFQEARAAVPDSRLMHNNRVTDLLAIAAEMLRGEILYRKGAYEEAFAHLRRSVELDDALPYDEPWGWMQPTRHALGALLLEQGHVEEAEAVYRADLGLGGHPSRAAAHPDNVWSLKGLHDCLTRRGAMAEAQLVGQRLELALARADPGVAASCFCAQAAMEAQAEETGEGASGGACCGTG